MLWPVGGTDEAAVNLQGLVFHRASPFFSSGHAMWKSFTGGRRKLHLQCQEGRSTQEVTGCQTDEGCCFITTRPLTFSSGFSTLPIGLQKNDIPFKAVEVELIVW